MIYCQVAVAGAFELLIGFVEPTVAGVHPVYAVSCRTDVAGGFFNFRFSFRPTVAGDFQVLVVIFAPTVAEIGYFVLPLRVDDVSFTLRVLFYAASEGFEHCRHRRCGSVEISKFSSPADHMYPPPPDRGYRSLVLIFALRVM